MKRLLWLLLLWRGQHALAATSPDCLAVAPLPMLVQIGAAPPQQVLLLGGSAPAMRIVAATSGDTLWSAGVSAPAIQHFAGMSAAFAGGFTALDTDGDGLHDRIYAGDLAGRIWRFDLFNGAPAGEWATGGVFADFSNETGRGFRAAPDVSLATAPGVPAWLHIAIGTAAPGVADADNRFYVLRDHAPFQAWTSQQYLDWAPLHESDLVRIAPGEPASAAIDAGWFITLDHGDVTSAALTVAGSTVFAIAESTADATGCRSPFSIATVMLATGEVRHDDTGWLRRLEGDMRLDTAFALVANTDPDVMLARCSFGTALVPGCDADLRPHRTWWRREDAE